MRPIATPRALDEQFPARAADAMAATGTSMALRHAAAMEIGMDGAFDRMISRVIWTESEKYDASLVTRGQ